jgi:predicted HicB family RNase H-like nuclease
MVRPKLPPGEAASERIDLRLTPVERQAYEQAAQDKGMSLSEWIRWHLNRASKRKKKH